MTDNPVSLYLCPTCQLPFKTEASLSLHVTNWHTERQAHKQPDPADSLWQDLVRRAFETPEGFQGFSESEKRYFAVLLLAGEVNNGGFDQYFFNSSGNYYKYALLGLEEMREPHALALLQTAKSLVFDDLDIPENTGERRKLLIQREDNIQHTSLYELDKQFYQDQEDLLTKSLAYAKFHGLL